METQSLVALDYFLRGTVRATRDEEYDEYLMCVEIFTGNRSIDIDGVPDKPRSSHEEGGPILHASSRPYTNTQATEELK